MARIDYDAVARDYDAARALDEAGLETWHAAVAPYFASLRLPLLDVGAGTGQWAHHFAGLFNKRIFAIEPSAAMRARASRSPAAGVSWLAGEAEHLPLAAGSCGLAWLSTVIHHIPGLAAAARELHRVLAPGSPLLIRSAFPGRQDRITLFRFFPEAARVVDSFPSVEATIGTFEAAGFIFESLTAVPQVSAPDLPAVRQRAALRADTTLRAITDDAFARGLAALDQAIAAGTQHGPFVDYLDLLVLRRGPRP